MDESRKQNAINRIVSGIVYLEIDNELYKCVQPTQDQKALSDLIYNNTFQDHKYSGMLNKDQVSSILEAKQIWTKKDQSDHDELLKYLDDLKVDLYKNKLHTDMKKSIRARIKQVGNMISKSLQRKHFLDVSTIEYHAEKNRQEFLLAVCILDINNNHIYNYNNFNSKSRYILNRFLNHSLSGILEVSEYREISRTEPFRSLWAIGKENVFNICSRDLSIDQRTLILYSRMYDNVYENPERPSDEVIHDDDMLDGWFIIEKRKQDKEKKQAEVDKMVGGHGGKGELFIVANSAEDADQIRSLNDINSKMKMQQREKAIKEKGKLEEHQLPDVQMELKQEAMRQMADRFKRK